MSKAHSYTWSVFKLSDVEIIFSWTSNKQTKILPFPAPFSVLFLSNVVSHPLLQSKNFVLSKQLLKKTPDIPIPANEVQMENLNPESWQFAPIIALFQNEKKTFEGKTSNSD